MALSWNEIKERAVGNTSRVVKENDTSEKHNACNGDPDGKKVKIDVDERGDAHRERISDNRNHFSEREANRVC